MEAIGFVHEDQSGRIQHRTLFGLIVFVCFIVSWIDWWRVARGAARLVHNLSSGFFIFESDFSLGNGAERWRVHYNFHQAPHSSLGSPDH